MLGVSMMVSSRSTAAWLSRAVASDIAQDAPAAQVLLADHLLALRLILEVTAVRHGDGERQGLAAAGSRLGMKADGELCLGDDPATEQRVVGAETVLRHLPDGLRRLTHAFEGHPLTDGVDRHQPQVIDAHRLDAITRIGRERVRALQYPQIELTEWQPLLPELRGQEVAGEEPDEV